MTATPRFGLPFLAPGQAQKELFHNEALQSLDVLVAAAVEGLPLAAPPSSPAIGNCYIVGASPSGAWAGRAHCIAAYTSGGWRFIAPRDGQMLMSKALARRRSIASAPGLSATSADRRSVSTG